MYSVGLSSLLAGKLTPLMALNALLQVFHEVLSVKLATVALNLISILTRAWTSNVALNLWRADIEFLHG